MEESTSCVAAADAILPHHVKEDVCHTRPKYRDGRKLKGVKVYTCAQESKYLLATNVPSINARLELIKLFQVYGNVVEHKMLDEYPCNEFCETVLVKFEKIQNARVAKIKLDDYNFFGGCIHVCYAPEYETVADLREKLDERRLIVASKCSKYEQMKFGTLEYDLKMKNLTGKLHYRKPAPKKPIKVNVEKASEEENPVFDRPKLPDDWVKNSLTGDESYDQTVQNIRSQMTSTIPQQMDTYDEREMKRKKKRVKL